MAPKNVAESELVQWLLDQANDRGSDDWGHQKLDEFLDLREGGPMANAYRELVRDVEAHSTATGSVTLRSTLFYQGRSVVKGYSLEGFHRSIAGPGAQAQAMQLICDPSGSYYKRVRRCAYSKCRRFFLPEQTAKGPLGKYCTDDCGTLGPKEKGNERVKAIRRGLSVKEFRDAQAKQEDET